MPGRNSIYAVRSQQSFRLFFRPFEHSLLQTEAEMLISFLEKIITKFNKIITISQLGKFSWGKFD